MSKLTLKSEAFDAGETIPKRYTCDGQEMSPPLKISGVPKNAKSLVLIVEDPDTRMGIFTHWVVFNIPPNTTKVLEEMPKTSATFGTPGLNGAGNTDYIGPCPPSGNHHYYFRLYALDTDLSLAAGASKEVVQNAMKGHVLEETALLGMYGRGT